jgi:ATP-dependent DNA ligase
VRDPFDREGWLFELKWDGFRAIARLITRAASNSTRANTAISRSLVRGILWVTDGFEQRSAAQVARTV